MKNHPLKSLALAIFILILLSAQAATAQTIPFETIVNNGGHQNRVDIAILGDGYTAAQMQKYRTDSQTFAQKFLEQEPFKEYQRFFNVHRVDVTSNQSGANHPENGVMVDNALGSGYNCNGVQRLICVDPAKVNTALGNTALVPTQIDITLVIVNDNEYGGSGGPIAVFSTNDAASEIALHELGHSFGLLADEYTDGPPPPCDNTVEPPEANATMATQRANIKWNAWIDAATPIPTTTTNPGVPGLYEGAKYCTNGLFRPTNNSKMRTVTNPALPFEQINSEQLVKRIYNFVRPIDSNLPANLNLTITKGVAQGFSITSPVPFTHTVTVNWLVDGQQRATGATFNLDTTPLTVGPHTVTAAVRDQSNFVRNDPANVLTQDLTWNLTINAPAGNPIDGTEFFVRQHYTDFLNRQPDAPGLAFWMNEITLCGNDANCIEVKRIHVSAAFYLSIEFQQTGYLVERLYKTAYGDATGTSTLGGNHQLQVPIVRFEEFLPDTQLIGQGVIVGQTGWEAMLENNKQTFCQAFVGRTRFTTAFANTMTPAQFVDRLFQNAGVTPLTADRDAAINEFAGAGDTSNAAARARALRRVAENATLFQQENNKAFVLMQYFGYLRRNPNSAPDADYTGYDFWLTKLNQFNGNFQNAEMVKAFITSGEYRQRFGP
jgi:hypothetical protein